MSDNDEQITKSRKTRTLTDEKRAELAARMRAINDKRILDAAKKIETEKQKKQQVEQPPITQKLEEKPNDLGKEIKPIDTPQPKKKKVIQIVQLESDDDEDEIEIQLPKQKAKKMKPIQPEIQAKPEPKIQKPRVSRVKETKPEMKTEQPTAIPQQPTQRCKFL